MVLIAKPPGIPEEMQNQKPSIDFMYVGADLPPLPPPEGTPFLQDIAKVSGRVHELLAAAGYHLPYNITVS